MIVSVRHCDQIRNEKNRITIRHTKIHDSTEKKTEIGIKHSQVLLTSKQSIINSKRQLCLSNLWKLKECLVVKTKKKEKLQVL